MRLRLLYISILLFTSHAINYEADINLSKTITLLPSPASSPNDTLGISLNVHARGEYDTLWDITTTYDTLREPVDILLSFDLSGSMDSTDHTSRWRITWAQIAALSFIERLKNGDRIAVHGWVSEGAHNIDSIQDTINTDWYRKVWFPMSNNFYEAKTFIKNELYLDSYTERLTDQYNGEILVKQDLIPNGDFIGTPLYASIIVGLRYLHDIYSERKKVMVILTDGKNMGRFRKYDVTDYISANTNEYLKLYTIGFRGGIPEELQEFADLGGGKFVRADDPNALDSAFSQIANEVILEEIDTSFSTSQIEIVADTSFRPVDILLAFDLSGSMRAMDGTSRWRITWAQIKVEMIIVGLKVLEQRI